MSTCARTTVSCIPPSPALNVERVVRKNSTVPSTIPLHPHLPPLHPLSSMCPSGADCAKCARGTYAPARNASLGIAKSNCTSCPVANYTTLSSGVFTSESDCFGELQSTRLHVCMYDPGLRW